MGLENRTEQGAYGACESSVDRPIRNLWPTIHAQMIGPFSWFLCALANPQPVGNQRDELPVGGLVVQRADVPAERLVQRLDAPAVPGDLDEKN